MTRFVFTRVACALRRGHVRWVNMMKLCFMVDQVVTDMRLWLRDAILTLTENALQLISTMVERAAAWDEHTAAHAHTRLVLTRLTFFSEYQWNPRSGPRVHPHAASSANTMEPLDSKVPVLRITFSVFFWDVVCFMSACVSLSTLVTLWPWAEMWTGLVRSRKELTSYLWAGMRCVHCPDNDFPTETPSLCCFQRRHCWNSVWHRQGAASKRSVLILEWRHITYTVDHIVVEPLCSFCSVKRTNKTPAV